jgi:hypothetical protein
LEKGEAGSEGASGLIQLIAKGNIIIASLSMQRIETESTVKEKYVN